ncbi:serine hydrolase [Caldivirga sp. UBA161]|uniref:serine hydrolase n=1 Tax=Caldivirga sp. UBA161 TaxID=1915569 RepID=UPI0025B9971F|nr:serine hydrolase [Caldivirga sp. UBA161]
MDFSGLEGFVLSKMREYKIPGLSIGIVKDGELIYARGFGFRDIEAGLPATPRTTYGIGSITKSFTALAILKLTEEGKLNLMDPVERYVQLRLRSMGEPVLIHHLLTHSSGIPALGYAEAFINGLLGLEDNWLPLATPEDVVAFMRGSGDWAVAKPGERFFYLNEGYVLLGYIIRKVTGLSYEDYISKVILKPLNMDKTYFSEGEYNSDWDKATPYIIDREGRHIKSRFPFGITSDGGLLSNVVDMSKYINMLINRGELNGVRILGRDYLELAERRYINVPWRMLGDEGYGYGLIVSDSFFGRRLVSHSGSVLVYTAYMAYVPGDKIGVIVLANADGYPLSKIGLYALTMMIGHNPVKELEVFRREEISAGLEGTYESYGGTVKLSIIRQGDYLIMRTATKYTEESTILVPEEVKDDYARYFTLLNGSKIYAEFVIRGNGVELIYERFKFIKRS